MNGTSLLNRLWLKEECFTWEITPEGDRLNHSWPLRKWWFYAFALLAVQLFIRLFCPDCLRIKKDCKGFWSHFIHMDTKIVTPLFNFLELLRCLWYKVCFFYHNWSCLLFNWEGTRFFWTGFWTVCCTGIALNTSVCASVFLLLLSKEVKRGFYFISLFLQPVTQVQSNLPEFERVPAKKSYRFLNEVWIQGEPTKETDDLALYFQKPVSCASHLQSILLLARCWGYSLKKSVDVVWVNLWLQLVEN